MRRWFVGFGGGFIVGLVLAGGMAIWYADYKSEHHHYMGQIDGLGEAMEAVRDEFGEVDSSAAGKALFHLKTSVAVVVIVDGVKTVRVVLLGTAACGDDHQASSPPPAPPPWAKVAPEQIAEAEKHGVPVAFENDLGMRFVLIPAGTFLMGSPEDEEGRNDNETQHEVTITKPYYMQSMEVTNAQYRLHEPDHYSGRSRGGSLNADAQPTVKVSWEDAAAFARWTSDRDENRTYRLPREAEWENACRAGTRTPFSFGETITPGQANYCSGDCVEKGPHGPPGNLATRVGSFPPNKWGLFDMHGNVWEWCHDWYGDLARLVTSPTGATSGEERVLRGGSWYDYERHIRSATRYGKSPVKRIGFWGLRLVSPLTEPKSSK